MKNILAAALIAVLFLGAAAAYSKTAQMSKEEYLSYMTSDKYGWVSLPYLGEKFSADLFFYEDRIFILETDYEKCKEIVKDYDKGQGPTSSYIKMKYALRSNEEVRTLVGWARVVVRLADASVAIQIVDSTDMGQEMVKDGLLASADLRKKVDFSSPAVRKKAFAGTRAVTAMTKKLLNSPSSQKENKSNNPPSYTEPPSPSYQEQLSYPAPEPANPAPEPESPKR